MDIMFFNCSSLKNLNCCNFTSDNIKNYKGMFLNCSSLENLDLSNFKVIDSKSLFEGINSNCNIKIQ